MNNHIDTMPERRELGAGRQAALKRSLLRQFSDEQHRPLFKRPQSLVIGTTAAVALGTAAAATYIESKYVPPSDTVLCYSKAEPGIQNEQPPVTMGRAEEAGAVEQAVIDDAIEACALAWRAGHLIEGQDEPAGLVGTDPNQNDFPVPPLVACVVRDDSIAVFPGDSSTCQTLGLPSPAPTPD
ncbi:hypothetical protein [Phytoactinopolyspora halotolerans]|uniref:Uncharacterized protein n=1 Tax=Phytoactinopolyspora halotolerans TaxID=1981512 RepID=A0A6L9SCP2_9ACTN|nr:hypothetical protein [Phytoactinopolyspora halotolerans]NEE02843.1 hypothetical protein [Phytoactinopolyspora halotolerans]